jgi:glutamyl-Q tRNA(Asp) synthetase
MITRFAPSPTGPLHLGHAFSVLTAHDMARAQGGKFHLRLDDIDQSRSRAHWAAQIEDDLAWLGITWDGPIWQQSARTPQYTKALKTLWDMGLLYTCTCTRADIKAAANAPQDGAPLHGPDGLIYPGTCRTGTIGAFPTSAALRFNIAKALQAFDKKQIDFTNNGILHAKLAHEMIDTIGDVVLARSNMAASYHLSIVVDDADQNISDIIRGEDLLEATFIHALLQNLLGYRAPNYHHHRLIRDETGKRLAKRDDARALSKYRSEGKSPNDIRDMLGLDRPATPLG